ncbi:MAG: endopeptidase La, partial [Candidatus Cloacimonetes bacterium]|nr:endopeptidase La [Candidatus Cloacimonadota bacterium]
HVAMTGEITLTGRVLAIGGLPEKLMAAKRSNIKKIILPKSNQPDFEEIKEEVKSGIEFIFVDNLNQALENILHPIKKTKNENKPIRKKKEPRSDK